MAPFAVPNPLRQFEGIVGPDFGQFRGSSLYSLFSQERYHVHQSWSHTSCCSGHEVQLLVRSPAGRRESGGVTVSSVLFKMRHSVLGNRVIVRHCNKHTAHADRQREGARTPTSVANPTNICVDNQSPRTTVMSS